MLCHMMRKVVSNRWWYISRMSWLIIILLITIWRAPVLLLEPRLWAEEGTKYFTLAYNEGFWKGFFAQHGGYYALIPNVATALATLVRLEYAPLLTTLFALVVQMVVFSIVVFGLSPIYNTWSKKILVSLSILVLAPGEVWLNTINSQYWVCIATFLLLLEPKEELAVARTWWYRSVLILDGLTCVLSSFLLPCYIFKAVRTKVKEEWTHVGILGFATMVQVIVLLLAIRHESQLPARFGANLFSLQHFIIIHFIRPFFGNQLLSPGFAKPFNDWFFNHMPILSVWNVRITSIVLSVALIGGFFVLAWKSRYYLTQQLIVLSFLLVTTLSTVLSLRMESGMRYAFAPTVMLAVFYVSLLSTSFAGRLVNWLILSFLCVFIVTAGKQYRSAAIPLYNPSWPKWRQEVQQWRITPEYKIQIWPQWADPYWYIQLQKKNELKRS